MLESTVNEAIIYGYRVYSKDEDGTEKGSICINIIRPKEETPKSFGWESTYFWVKFDDELFKYLKSILIKKSSVKIKLVPDYKDSNKYTSKLIQINDFIIKD